MAKIATVAWSELESRRLGSSADVPEYPLDDSLTFALGGPPVYKAPSLEFRGLLGNPTDREQLVLVSDTSPGGFTAFFGESAAVEYDGPLMPPCPPLPLEFKIPPGTTVRFRAIIDLWKYAYQGTPTVSINWRFLLWHDPQPSGRIDFQLPPRPEKPKPVPGGPPMPL